MKGRYTVRPMPRGTMFGVWDARYVAFCGLPNRRPTEAPDGSAVWDPSEPSWWVEFATAERAHAWLRWCVETWQTWPQEFAPAGYGRAPSSPRPRATQR